MNKSKESWEQLVAEYYTKHALLSLDRTTPEFSDEHKKVIDLDCRECTNSVEFLEKYNELAEFYITHIFDEQHMPIFTKVSGCVAKMISELQPHRVLDIGCGVGWDICFLAINFPEIEFIGTDISPKMIHIAQEKAHELGLSNVTFYVCAHGELNSELIGGEVDVCCTLGSLFFDRELQLIEHIYGVTQVVKEHGRLIVTMAEFYHFQGVEIAANILGFSLVEGPYVVDGKDDTILFTLGMLEKTEALDQDSLAMRMARSQPRYH